MRNGGFTRNIRLLLATLLAGSVAVALAPIATTTQAAFPTAPTTFEIDSNTVAGTGTDWLNQPGVRVSNDTNYAGAATVSATPNSPNPNCQSSNSDTVFKNSTNISDPVFDQFETQSVPDKTDVCQSYFASEVVQTGPRAGHIIAYLGFTRRASNGDGSFYFLLSKGSNPNVRVAGDIGIQVDYGSQGQPQQLTTQVWQAGSPPTLSARSTIPLDDPNVQLSPVQYFAELAIDLTALNLAPNVYELPDSASCLAFGYGRIISRTGNSPSATLKDDGRPTELDFNVCGRVDVTKVVTAAVPNATTFEASLVTPAGVTVPDSTLFDLVVPAGQTTSPTTTFGLVPPRLDETFSVTETLGALDAQWDLDSIVCTNDNGTPTNPADDRVLPVANTFNVFTDEIVDCVITNSPAPARVNVTKAVTPAGAGTDLGTEWTINLTGETSQLISEDETISFLDLAPGSFTLSETDPANAPGQPPFDVVGWSCENGTVTSTGASVGIVLDPGAVYDCTVTNELVPEPQIEVVKTALPTSFQEPDGTVVYSVQVSNPGTEPLTVSALVDAVSLNGGADTVLDLGQDAPGAAAGGTVTLNSCDTAVMNQTIPAGGQVTCSFTVGYADRNAGDVIDDVVTVTGTDAFGRTVQDTDDARVDVTNRPPVITVDKQNVEPVALVAPGGAATYSVVVTNGPNAVEAITITSIADVFTIGGATFGPANVDITTTGAIVTSTSCGGLIGRTLQPGESTLASECTFTVDTTQLGAVAQDDVLVNTATVTAVDDEDTEVSDADPADRTVLGAPPQMGVFKTDNGAIIDEPGEQVTYTVDVFNLGTTEALTITQITDEVFLNGDSIGTLTWGQAGLFEDALPAGVFVSSTCGDLIGDVLAKATGFEPNGRPSNAGATASCTITLDLVANASDVYDDTVTVDAVDETGDPVEAENSAQTPAQGVDPTIQIVKTANPTAVPETGGDVTFTFEITNTSVSTDPLEITELDDSVFGNLLTYPGSDCADLAGAVLDPGESVSCSLTAPLTGNVGADHVNVASVTGVDDEGVEATDDDDAEVEFLDVLPTITVDKTANPTSVPESGANVTYTVEVTNTSDEDVVLTSLTDNLYGDLADPLNPALVNTTCTTGGTIVPGGTYECTFTALVRQEAAETAHVNVVTGTAVDDEQNTATDDDDAVVTFELIPPTVEITKTDEDAFVNEPGGTVTYTITVENTSFEAVTVTSLTDTITYEEPAQVIGPIDLLAPVAPVSNSTCATELGAVGFQLAPAGQPGDSIECSFDVALAGTSQIVRDTVAVVVVDDDDQTDTDTADEATPIVDVPPTVEVEKTADPTIVRSGDDVTYTFVITNPSTFEALTLLSFTDDTYPFAAGECDITGVVLPPLGTFECEITRPVTGANGSQVTNIATVTAADDELLDELAEEGSTAVPVSDTDDAVVDVVEPGSIAIEKLADPADGDDLFSFSLLRGDGNPVAPDPVLLGGGDSHTWAPLDAGTTEARLPVIGATATYTLTEADDAADRWQLTDVTCVDVASGETIPFQNGGDIVLAWGQDVECSFTNVEDGTITIEKQTLPDGSTEEFGFDVSWSDDDVLLADGESETFQLAPGDYSFVELLDAEAGWDLTDIVCTAGDSVVTIGDDATFDAGDTGADIDLAAGDDVSCVVTNTQDGTIIVNKVVDGENDGTFGFSLAGAGAAGPFNITTVGLVGQETFGPLAPGTYVLTETDAGAAYDGTDLDCVSNLTEDPSVTLVEGLVATIELDPSEIVTCTYTNTERGAVLIDKVTVPAGDTTAFDFDVSWSDTDVALADGDAPASSGLLPAGGTYTVTEQAETGWQLTEVSCSNGDVFDVAEATASVTLDPAEVVTCTFENTKLGPVLVEKSVVSGPTQQAGTDLYDVTYEIEVTNESYLGQTFDLADVLGLVAPVAVEGTPVLTPAVPGASFDDATDTFTFSGQPIAARATQTYELAVTVRVPGATTTERDCVVDPVAPGGALNQVTVEGEQGGPDEGEACVGLPEPELTRSKSLTGEADRDENGTWTVAYTLEVTNVGDGPGVYTLEDELQFGAGVVVESVDVTVSSTGQTDPAAPSAALAAFDGGSGVNGGGTTVVEDAEIVAGATHTYVVTVTATIPDPVIGSGACDPDGEQPGGFLNTAVLLADGVTTDPVTACDEFSTLTLVKDVVNDDGGNAVAEDFTLIATDGEGVVVVEGDGFVTGAVEAGSYELAETQLDGYVASDFECVGPIQEETARSLAMATGTAEVPEGGDVTCTVVNDDQAVDLELTKDDGGITVLADRTAPFPYTIEVTNLGPRELDDEPVVVTDVLPAAFNWSAPLPAGCVQSGKTLTCTLDPASLRPVGTTVTITANVVLVPGTAAGTYDNQAWVTTADDPVCEGEGCTPPPCTDTEAIEADNDVDCEPTPVESVVNIRAFSPECVGDAPYIAYDLDLAGVAFPGIATLTFFDKNGNFVETRVVTATEGRVVYPGAQVDGDGNAIDWPGWKFENGLWVVDPTDAILRDGLTVRVDVNPSATTTVTYPPSTSACADPEQVSADLAIVKDASVTTAERGGTFNWVLTVTNNGPDPATNVVVSDTVPAPFVVTAAGSSTLSCSNAGNVVTCTGPSLAVGATATVVVTVATPVDAAEGTITNFGSVQATTPDPNLSNNVDDASVTIPAAVVLPPPPPPAPAPQPLPATGSNVADVLRTAALLLAAGFVVLGVSRRRRGAAS